MSIFVVEWGSLLLRWFHIITGMAWIGASFYFMHLDASLRPVASIPQGKGGETWEVHGGGFYQVRKYLVAPDQMPADLIWHKWQAYSTWLSGFALLVWVYYLSADLYLIDPEIRVLTSLQASLIGIGALAVGWLCYDVLVRSPLAKQDSQLAAIGFVLIIFAAYGFQQVFSGRGALIHTGALMATIMTGNVFLNIIPNQKKVVADLLAGRTPNPDYGKQAKTRSTHNNYLTLPVVFLMISGHYPLVTTSPYAWIIVGLVLVAGALVRYLFNELHAGRGFHLWPWLIAALAVLLAALISFLSNPAARETLGLAEIPAVQIRQSKNLPLDIASIIETRCSMCHAAQPVWDGLLAPPKGIKLDTPDHIHQLSSEIRLHAVITHAMPPNNLTQMTSQERQTLGRWLATL